MAIGTGGAPEDHEDPGSPRPNRSSIPLPSVRSTIPVLIRLDRTPGG